MAAFNSVAIIYNPKSTGSSKEDAKELEKSLKETLRRVPIKCIATKYAGHAEELAYELAKSREKPLIISSSGDGGYNEVINGVMQAGRDGRSAICAVLPAGNANDHSRTMQDRPLWKAIKKGKVAKIDLLRVNIQSSESTVVRYAHSYVGLGLTPVIATELNRHTLNSFKESILVIKTFFKHRPFKIRRGSRTIRLDSLIFANINQMAKVLTLAKSNKPDDGQFEVISFPHGHKFLLIKKLFKAAAVGLKTTKRTDNYSFRIIKKMPMQLDGEVVPLAAGTKVQITAAKKILQTFV